MSDSNKTFSSDNLDFYLKELAKEFRKLNGKNTPAEIIIVGGAAILLNYGFRDMTTDVDAVIHASSALKDAARIIGDKYNLTTDWLNSKFTRTSSYSPKLEEYSTYYRTFANILSVRTISEEYLVAMKLVSYRPFKHDLSDIAFIIYEHQKSETPFTEDIIMSAVEKLYGDTSLVSDKAREFLRAAINADNPEMFINEIIKSEEKAKSTLLQFDEQYEGVLNEKNIDEILKSLTEKPLKKNKDNYTR